MDFVNNNNIMNFVSMLTDELMKDSNDRYSVSIEEIDGNIAMVIKIKNTRTTPVFYLEKVFEEYNNGNKTLENIIEAIKEKIELTEDINKSFMNYEEIKDNIGMRIIHEDNVAEHSNHVYIPSYKDDYIMVPIINIKEGLSAYITKELLRAWQEDIEIDEEDIYLQAIKNIKIEDINFRSMASELFGMFEEEVNEDLEKNPMYILSGDNKFGASMILSKDVRKTIWNMLGEDYHVIISSIWECLILPVSRTPVDTDFEAMIYNINRTAVDKDEMSSDLLYIVTKDSGYTLVN